MGNRAVQAVTVIVALALGVGVAFGVHQFRGTSNQQATNSTPTPAASPSASPSPSPSPSTSPSPSPTQTPSAAPTSTPGGGTGGQPAGYPAQIRSGSAYPYSGSGSLAALATDSQDSGTSICAGITNTGQNIPTGYIAAYFVSVTFPNGNILSAGYLREGTVSNDFGQIQNGSTKTGNRSQTATAAGTHNYCVTRGSSGWVMTADGANVYGTSAESATSTAGATLRFESTIQPVGSPQVTSLSFVVPGFQNIAIDGHPPTQLVGSTITF